jgi:hypothetical protein
MVFESWGKCSARQFLSVPHWGSCHQSIEITAAVRCSWCQCNGVVIAAS